MSTLFGIPNVMGVSGVSSAAGIAGAAGAQRAAGGEKLRLARTDPRHLGAEAASEPGGASFEDAMLRAMDGVNALQMDSSDAMETMLTDPDSIDTHDVTIAMAKASMSLNITKTVLSRVVTAWKDVINTR